jgi:hypothetical protein
MAAGPFRCASSQYNGIIGASSNKTYPDTSVRFLTVGFHEFRAMIFRISRPMLLLNMLVVVGAVFGVFAVYRGVDVSERSNYLWTACFSYCVAWWIEVDRKARRITAPFDYQAFMFFLWPAMAPYYLFQTRGWRGLVHGMGLLLLACVPAVTEFVAHAGIGDAP